MKRLVVYIIMLLYVNSYMFFPIVDDVSSYDEYGNLADEINSVVEFFDQVVFQHKDVTPDGNEAQHFHIAKHRPIVINQFAVASVNDECFVQYEAPRQYAIMGDQKATYRAYDVVAPPPKA